MKKYLMKSALFAIIALSLAAAAHADVYNEITAVNPNSAGQGTSSLTITFTLDTDSPPAPPSGILPQSVAIGSISGTSVTHTSQYTVTAVFNIPAGEPAAAKDAIISFSTPNGTLIFSKTGGFTVTANSNIPASVTQNPQSQTVASGSSVTFTVAASGTSPLSYQWQKNDANIPSATGSSLTISSAALSDAGSYRCVVTNNYGRAASDQAILTVNSITEKSYRIVDTGQVKFYNASTEITAPAAGAAFYGQDAQYTANISSYIISADGLTVYDNVTGLTWQRSPDTNGNGSIIASDKFNWTNAQARPATLNAANYGGYNDWRLPTIKELYSLVKFNGTDPSGLSGNDTSGLTAFIDTNYFKFAYGDTSAGERIIDSQYASSTLYAADSAQLFGVNFADGRIKGYGLVNNGTEKTFFVQCVRGNTSYGINLFVDNGDQTISDKATGLMWSKADSGSGMNWQNALAWAQTQNSQNYLGYSDWRLPNAKELQSIIDYTRSPDTTGSAAINAVFTCTQIINEKGQVDYPWYWTGTTHASYNGSGSTADYLCFGRALGYMSSTWVDIHGAGCQRSDPKSGSLSSYTYAPYGYYNSIAPQGDAIRIYNYVRLVRDVQCGQPGYVSELAGDLNSDCYVNFLDLAKLGQMAGWEMSDLILIVQNWLDCIDPYEPCNY